MRIENLRIQHLVALAKDWLGKEGTITVEKIDITPCDDIYQYQQDGNSYQQVNLTVQVGKPGGKPETKTYMLEWCIDDEEFVSYGPPIKHPEK